MAKISCQHNLRMMVAVPAERIELYESLSFETQQDGWVRVVSLSKSYAAQ